MVVWKPIMHKKTLTFTKNIYTKLFGLTKKQSYFYNTIKNN